MKPAIIFAALCVTLVAPFGAALTLPPQAGQPVLVVVPPWQDAARMIDDAGGNEIGPFTAPFARLAISDDPRFAESLRALGSWAVRDGATLARLCGVSDV